MFISLCVIEQPFPLDIVRVIVMVIMTAKTAFFALNATAMAALQAVSEPPQRTRIIAGCQDLVT